MLALSNPRMPELVMVDELFSAKVRLATSGCNLFGAECRLLTFCFGLYLIC